MKRILVTGGAGFIGSNFVRHALKTDPDIEVINLDVLTYAGNLENLRDIEDNPRYRFIKGDICDAATVRKVIEEHTVEAVVHFAAESHVDRSISGPEVFVETNVRGTLVLLEAARQSQVSRFVQVSTDEVYGSLGADGRFSEDSPIQPNSPYAASKAAADHFVQAYGNTHGLPWNITRCSNNYGPWQFPEKMVPLMIHNAMHDRELPVYGDGLQIRDWIHVSDHCEAVWQVLNNGTTGEVYNIGADNEMSNIELVKLILSTLGKPQSLIRHITDRPGHDRRYAIDSNRIQDALGWKPRVSFDEGIAQTIEWYKSNAAWLQHLVSGEYRKYYEKQYSGR